MTTAFTYTYNRTHSFVFLADNMRNALRDVISEYGLKPDELLREWDSWIKAAVKAWLDSGHLNVIVIEFYKPGATAASARWDFPIRYSGSGVDDDMWMDKAYLRQLIAKAAKPTSDCIYRIILQHDPNPPAVPGTNLVDITFKSTANLSERPAGTVIATSHLTASASYWSK
jgi:hypothetical protein